MSLPGHRVDFERFVVSRFEGYVTKIAPQKALQLVARGKLTFDERVVLHHAKCDEEDERGCRGWKIVRVYGSGGFMGFRRIQGLQGEVTREVTTPP